MKESAEPARRRLRNPVDLALTKVLMDREANEQMGHKDYGALSMSVYARALRRRERLTGATPREYDRALHWAVMDGQWGRFQRYAGPRRG
jgi:hypothetical protein